MRVVRGRAAPAQFHLKTGVCRIGAGAGNDIVIIDETVSRNHAELELSPHGVVVRDLNSRNGTFYLGQRVTSIVLGLGSPLRVGNAELQIDVDSDALAAVEPGEATHYGELLGTGVEMRALFGQLTRLEGSLVSVLIEGESGTGKEVVARSLHEQSAVRGGPFVAVNCGALDRALARSELFGHRKGSFTGAVQDHVGAFESANGGTLFLDEIGELALDLQPLLLRTLEERAVTPLGASGSRPLSVRLIAATNRNLEEDAESGRFRSDLYYRLAVVKLTVPPLRSRLEDLELFARHFAEAAGIKELPSDVIARLRQRSWQGNVRELKNAILAYAAVGSLPPPPLGAGRELDWALRREIDPSRPYAPQKEEFLQQFTRVYLELLLKTTDSNQSEAARISGIERSYLGKLASKFGFTKK